MQNLRVLFIALALIIFLPAFVAPAAESAQQSQGKVRVLLVTGGHGFEKEPFFKLFQDNPDITSLTRRWNTRTPTGCSRPKRRANTT
jgi:hypothetical protein